MSGPLRPPFGVIAGQSPDAAAADIVAVFDAVAGRPDKVQWVERETTRRFDAATDSAMAASSRASRAIARAIDADARQADRLAYHNRQHFCEVVLVACFLGQLHALPAREAQRLLLAALVHDLGHDGRMPADFRNERRSLALASPFLRDAGVAADERRRLAALVLATEPGEGTRAALRAAAAHASNGPHGGAVPVPVPVPVPELAALHHDASLADLAVLLCEADLLPSAGLTAAHGRHLQACLALEWQRPLDDADKRRFLDAVLADGTVGPFFRPNVTRWRARLGSLPDGPTPR